MTVKDRTGRRMRRILAPLTMMVTALLGLGVPNPALAEQHVRMAPYDFGSRCMGQGSPSCQPDEVARVTGTIERIETQTGPCLPLSCPSFYGTESSSSVGILFDVDAPGTLTVTVAAAFLGDYVDGNGLGSMRVCVRVYRVSPNGWSLVHGDCDWNSGAVNLQVVAEVSDGRYSASVDTYAPANSAGAAIVEMITYEVAP